MLFTFARHSLGSYLNMVTTARLNRKRETRLGGRECSKEKHLIGNLLSFFVSLGSRGFNSGAFLKWGILRKICEIQEIVDKWLSGRIQCFNKSLLCNQCADMFI